MDNQQSKTDDVAIYLPLRLRNWDFGLNEGLIRVERLGWA